MRVSRSGREALVPPSYRILGAFLLLSPLCTLCDGHSSKRLPLAGIFGLGGKKDEPPPPQHNLQSFPQQQYSRQPPLPQGRGQPPPSRGDQGQRRPPPPQPGQGIRPSLPVSQMVPPEFRNKDPRYPPQRPPPPPPVEKEETVAISQAEVKEAGAGEEVKENQERIMAEEATELENTSDQNEEQEATKIPPPPPPPQWGASSFQQPPPQQGWMGPPQTEYGGWEPPYYEEQYTGNQMFLQEELDESLARENNLIGQLDNLTTAVVIMEQREELHMRQLDVLTERVMDVEALSAEDRNLLVEYAANCTTFGQTIATLQDELDEWQKRCNDFTERHEEDQENLSELKKMIREKERDAEELAIAMENLRLAERREASRSQKKGGIFSWMFSFLISSNDEYEEVTREEAYEMAKSTLLRALQSERGNVHELEAAVASLQQNNSAIAEMVESRDTIIDELNSRIAVFEEDKGVLKAALRQLQKEIKEEAPKAQKLMDDLSKAGEEVKRLNAEVNGIIRTHQEEVNALQKTLSMKQKKISESESNMTSIGTYVDKLEERLTSFAIKRRDMETREAKCKEIEEAAAVTETERQMLRVKVDEYSTEQEELKKILEELAIERGNLQKDNRRLLTESEFRIGEQEQMQAKCTALESEEKTLSEGVLEWRGKCEGLVPALEAAKKSNLELQSRVENMNGVEEELKVFRSQNVELQESYEKIQEELRSVRTENERLDALVNKTTESVDEQEINEGTRESVDEQEINEDTREERLEADSRKPLQPPTFPIPPSVVTRDVPFRIIRKKFSEATGIHGLLTPSSKMTRKERGPPPKMQQRPAMPHLPKTRVMPDGQIPGPPPLPQETPN